MPVHPRHKLRKLAALGETIHLLKKTAEKLYKWRYKKDSWLLKLVLLASNTDLQDDDKIPTRADFVEKREIDRSTLYSFDSPFQLVHAEVGNL